MRFTSPSLVWLVVLLPVHGAAQQVPDSAFAPPIEHPAYPVGGGPVVLLDEAHCNFHTAGGRYYAFAQLLRRDGYAVRASTNKLDHDSLNPATILVVANATAERNCGGEWTLPTPSAFSGAEIRAVRDWVRGGGSLFLIADHMPFPGNVSGLATAFGITFNNGFTFDERERPLDYNGRGSGETVVMATRADGSLAQHSIIEGRTEAERIDSVVIGRSASAFMGGLELRPLIRLGPSAFALMPLRAWDFDDNTPRVALDGWLLAATLEVGDGRVAVFGEAAMLTAQLQGPERHPMSGGMNDPAARKNPQLVLNVMHWLSGISENE